jgi:hypothetical protein
VKELMDKIEEIEAIYLVFGYKRKKNFKKKI